MLKPAKTIEKSGMPIEQSWNHSATALADPCSQSGTCHPAESRFRVRFPDQFSVENKESAGPVLNALRQHGNFTLAYNTFAQTGLEYFFHDSGYIAYQKVGRDCFVVGDPVAEPSETESIIDHFLDEFPKATFAQVSESTAEVLSKKNFYLNEMGVDTHLPLETYNFDGKHKERIRYASNWLTRRGFQIVESDFEEVSPKEVKSVSDSWRKSMNYSQKEMGFLNRQIQFFDEQDVRKFFLLDPEGKIVSFFYFDPLYQDGQVIGYSTAIKRRTVDCPIYAEQGMMRHAVEKFKAEGKSRVQLGLSPLAWIKNDRFKRNPFLHFSFRMGFQSKLINKYFFNLQGHAKYKRHFKGVETPTYYASKSLFNDLKIFRILRLTGII